LAFVLIAASRETWLDSNALKGLSLTNGWSARFNSSLAL